MTTEVRIQAVLEHYFGTELSRQDLAAFETRELAGGAWLFRQGADGDSLYLLARGRLQAWLEGSAGDEPVLLGEIAPGDSVGEMSLFSGQARSASIRAVRDSLLVRIDRQQFDALASNHPALVTRLAANVVAMMQKGTENRRRFRPPRTIAIVELGSGRATRSFSERLVSILDGWAEIAVLDPASSALAADAETLSEWLHVQEDAHEIVLYQFAPGNEAWNEMARRQADLILYVADANDALNRRQPENAADDYGARHALVLLQPPAGQPIRDSARWLDAYRVDFHLHVRDGEEEDISRVARVVSGRAVGLVLSAGAARGFAHIGVYRAMRELGIPVDWIGGSSIGSIMGAAMAAGWDMDDIIATARKCFVQGKPFSDYTVPVTSLIRGRRMTRLLNRHLDYQIEDLPIPFFCVSSVLDDGTLNLHRRGQLASALCASAALPGVIPPAVVNKRLTIDGSVLNSLPVDLMQQMPVGRIVAVDLSSQKTYEVDYQQIPSVWRVLAGRYLPGVSRQRVPSLSTIMLKATEIGTLARMREFGQRADILLQPDVRGFGITQVKTFDRIVEAGYRCAIEQLSRWPAEPGEA